jgi:hypothetical protein
MFIFLLTRHMKLAKDKVSFSIRLASFQASGWSETIYPLHPDFAFSLSPQEGHPVQTSVLIYFGIPLSPLS